MEDDPRRAQHLAGPDTADPNPGLPGGTIPVTQPFPTREPGGDDTPPGTESTDPPEPEQP